MQTVYILGAGASRFAGFPLGKDLLPFLKSEYYNTRGFVSKDLWKRAIDFIEEVKGSLPQSRILKSGEPDLEFVFSLIDRIGQNTDPLDLGDACLLDDIDDVIETLQLRMRDLAPVKQGFLSLVTLAFQYQSHLLLDRGCKSVSSGFRRTSKAWTDLLSPGDTLLTFNWDLVQEVLLWKAKKWSYQDGYGIQTHLEDSSSSASLVTILKPHGSCNWALRHEGDPFVRVDYADVFFDATVDASEDPPPLGSTSDYGTSLIVPSYLKDPLRVSALQSVWKRAAEKLTVANKLVVLGYSLPSADFFAQRLFQSALEQNASLTSITVVLGTDEEAFGRWEALCTDAEKDCTTVRKTFEEYVTGP